MATEENWEEVLRSNYTDLLKNISTEFGLFGELRKARIFTPIALKSFMDCKDTTEKIDRILRNLQKKDFDSFKKFCEALNNSAQEYVVTKHLSKVQDVSSRHVTTTDSLLEEDSSHYRAISVGMSECFKQHWNDLIAEINFDEGLLSEVERRKIFTTLQINRLRDNDNEMKRTEQMLTWLERGSEKQFVDFCDALKVNNQQFVVRLYLTPKIFPVSNPPVIQENLMQSHEIRNVTGIRIAPGGSSGFDPVPAEVTLKDIRFLPCKKEFLIDFENKVSKKVAYKFESKPHRGRALIMNNMFFSHLAPRHGSNVDTENLEALFKRLHFDTVLYTNQDAKEMWEILKKESQEDHHKGYDMFVLFLMSHGVRGEIYGIDGNSLKTADIMSLFNGKNCPNLLEKPKLFFVQACQGIVKTMGVTATDTVTMACDSVMPEQHRDTIPEEMMQKLDMKDDFDISIPITPKKEFESDAVADDKVHEMADMAVIYATVEGYVAWRRIDTGSLFVHCLINVLTQRAHETDLIRMITEVFNMLHELEMVENQGRYKQIGEKRDTLRREVYLLPL